MLPSQAYESSPDSSTALVSSLKWRLALGLLGLTIGGGLVLALALALGLADPPRAGVLKWESANFVDWKPNSDNSSQYPAAPVNLPAPPFTLEVEAANTGSASSAWGIWLETISGEWQFLVSHDGYISTGPGLDWREFMHVRSGVNKLYLNVEANGQATWRVNQEIAWAGQMDFPNSSQWGIVILPETEFKLYHAQLYAP